MAWKVSGKTPRPKIIVQPTKKTNIKEKIYCENCKYIGINYSLFIDTDSCMYKSNVVYKDTFYSKSIKKYISFPRKLNKNNDCKWYRWKNRYS